MEFSLILRYSIAIFVALGLSFHGLKKKSLNTSGSLAAIFVGFASFACSYRFGFILILFYYSSSKFTKWKQDYKASIEEDYAVGGQRNWVQVLASSALATWVAISYYLICGEDGHLSFREPTVGDPTFELGPIKIAKSSLATYLWVLFIAHYCTANADTWASELGVLSKGEPRLVTSLFTRTVPRGTNGGMSLLGTVASGAGGLFIGVIFWMGSFAIEAQNLDNNSNSYTTIRGNSNNSSSGNISDSQYPILVFSLLCGLLGSLVDSILGATVQATYYSKDRRCIVKLHHASELREHQDKSIVRICGCDLLSNEAVNFVSIFVTMLLSLWMAPNVFCLIDSTQCFEAHRINSWLL